MRARTLGVLLALGLLAAGGARAEDGEEATPPPSGAAQAGPGAVVLPPAPPGVLNEGSDRPLTLQEAVRLALRANLALRAGRLDSAIAMSAYQSERAIFDPLLSASFDYAHDEVPSTSSFFGRNVVQDNGLGVSAGVQQLLPTGGTVRFLYRSDRLSTDSLFVTINPSWTNALGVEASQPLMRGAGDIVMSNIRRAHNDVVAARENVRAQTESTLYSVALAYWELARLQEDLRARYKSEETAAELLRDAEARYAGGVGTPLDVAEAEAGLELRRGNRILAEGALAREQDRLRTLLMPFRPDDGRGVAFRAVDDVNQPSVTPPRPEDVDRYVQIATSNRHEVKAAKAGLASNNVDVIEAANAVLPQLDVVGSIGSAGLKTGYADSSTSMFTGQAVSGAIGLRFSMFLGQRAARSRLRLSEWARRQAILRFQDLENQIVDEVRTGVRTVVTAQAVVETARAQVVSAEENLRGERQLLEQGKSTSYRVLQKEEDLTSARVRLSTAATEVRKAEAGFWRSLGLLGQNLGVDR